MGIASDAIARGILVGLARSGAITPEQLDEVFANLWQEEAVVGANAPGSAKKIELFIIGVRHQLRLDPEPRPTVPLRRT